MKVFEKSNYGRLKFNGDIKEMTNRIDEFARFYQEANSVANGDPRLSAIDDQIEQLLQTLDDVIQSVRTQTLPGTQRQTGVPSDIDLDRFSEGRPPIFHQRPVIAGISPATGFTGTTISAIISGTFLTSATDVNFSGKGVTATIGTGGTDTNLPVSITINPNAPPNVRMIQVVTPLGTSLPFSSFTILSIPLPVITSIAPSSGSRGTTIPAIISGTGLTGATAVNFLGVGVSAVIGVGGTDTSLPISITIAANAPLTTRLMQVITPGGTSQSFSGFTVTA